MIKGTTNSGFNFKLADDVFDDYELLESLTAIDHGAYGDVTLMVTKLLGEEQKNKLKDHIRDKKGKVSAQAMVDEIVQIFNEVGSGKNS